jgi:hypothetical protein
MYRKNAKRQSGMARNENPQQNDGNTFAMINLKKMSGGSFKKTLEQLITGSDNIYYQHRMQR